MDKWKKYGTYERWQHINRHQLESDWKARQADKYDWSMPDTYVSYDDFCMSVWQSLK
jgi:hypothetical protein